MDYTASVCLEHLSKLERDQLQEELDFIQLVQQALLPQEIPQITGLELAAFCRPAQIVSGDYFDFFQFKDGSPGVVIADAMGHGVSASLITTSLQTALRTISPESHSPAEALQRANRYFIHNSHFTTFVSVFLGQYQPASRKLIYCNAGHNPPALYRQSRSLLEWLRPTGAAIGLIEDNPLETATIQLEAGDILLLYTDGVTEATNARQEDFGAERLAATLLQNAHLGSREVVQAVRRTLQDFTNGRLLRDDVTLVAAKLK
jgi:sigma-B regulation protein RsbU (phosphoserine phosphatase)